jgi:hypothetical protein
MLLTLAILASVVLWAAPNVGAQTTVSIGSHSATFYGVRYDYPVAGRSTWYYKVTSGRSPALSHVVFQMTCPDIRILGAGLWDGVNMDMNTLYPGQGAPEPSSFPARPKRDPTTNTTGLKFNQGFDDGQTKYYYFTVNGNYAVGDITLAAKAGPSFQTGTIPGPSLVCAIVAKASLGDYVWFDQNSDGIQDEGEPGIEGATVRLYDANDNLLKTTTTDANGYYLFDGLTPGGYYVIFAPPDNAAFAYSPTSQHSGQNPALDSDAHPDTGRTQTVTLNWGDSYLDLDAGYVAKASLGDYVWFEQIIDGIQGAGEPGIPGVSVTLYRGDGTFVATTTTNANGYYLFDGLDAGDYYVVFAVPVDPYFAYFFTLQDAGPDALDSDADPITGRTQTVTLNWGDNYLDLDAGFYGFPVVPSAVTVSSFETLRDNDTLRFMWTTGYEADNRGFDLFAVQPGGGEMIQINEAFIPTQGFTTGSEYYYQADRSDIAVGALFYLRAYDLQGGYEDYGPVEAVYSASIVPPPGASIVPNPPVPCTPGQEGCRPVAEPRSAPVPLPGPVKPEKPIASPSLPVIGPELPAPVVPGPGDSLRPDPIVGKSS